MKKFAWIIALLAALSLGFFSCAEPEGSSYRPAQREQEVLEEVVVFDMQNAANGTITHGIQALTAGDLNFPSSGPTDISPLVKAGNMPDHISSFKAVTVGGKTALEYVTVATWGPGFDLPHSVFGFRAGDKITITGTAAGSTINLSLNVAQGNNSPEIAGNRATTSPFTVEATLTAADIGKIAGNEQKVIRFEDRAGNTTVTITQIKIEGMRPANITTLPAPSISLSGNTLSWNAIAGASGYKLYADGELISSTVSGTSVDLQVLLNNKPNATYSITLVASGTAGTTRDSAASNAVSYAFAAIAVPVTIKVGGTDVTAHVKLYGGTAKFEAIAGGYKVTGGHNYSTSFPMVVVDLDPVALSNISSISFKAKQVSGDVGYKRFEVSAADAASPSWKVITRKFGRSYTSGDSTVVEGWWTGAPAADATPVAKQVTLSVFSAFVTDSGIGAKTNLAFSLNPGVSSTAAYEITDIEIGTGGNAADQTLSGDLLKIALSQPLFGVTPPTALSLADAHSNPVYTGTVRWSPVTASGKFELFEKYDPTIILTPAKTYVFPNLGFSVNGDSSNITVTLSTPSALGILATIVYTGYRETEVLGEPGVVYDMSKDTLTAGAFPGTHTFLGFNNEGGASAAVVTEGGKTFIRITDRTDNGTSIYVKTGAAIGNKHEGLRYKITITEKVSGVSVPFGETGDYQQVLFQRQGGGYGYINDTMVYANNDPNGLFTITRTFSWEELTGSTGTSTPNYRLISNGASTNIASTIDYYTILVEAIAY